MDLRTNYLGLNLPHPLMPGASPMVDRLDLVKRLEDAGAAAIVMHSLFEEQLMREEMATYHHMHTHEESFAEALTYLPRPDEQRGAAPVDGGARVRVARADARQHEPHALPRPGELRARQLHPDPPGLQGVAARAARRATRHDDGSPGAGADREGRPGPLAWAALPPPVRKGA